MDLGRKENNSNHSNWYGGSLAKISNYLSFVYFDFDLGLVAFDTMSEGLSVLSVHDRSSGLSDASLSEDKTSVTWSPAIASFHPAMNIKFELNQLKYTGKEPSRNLKYKYQKKKKASAPLK